jgi:hypothetical protein
MDMPTQTPLRTTEALDDRAKLRVSSQPVKVSSVDPSACGLPGCCAPGPANPNGASGFRFSDPMGDGYNWDRIDAPVAHRRRPASPGTYVPDWAGDLPDADMFTEDDPLQSSVAADAQLCVYGDRQDDYGHPREDFTRTAIIWTGLLQHKLADGAYIEAEDIARCMVGVKLARDVHSPRRDNRVDGIGYLITLDRLETGK